MILLLVLIVAVLCMSRYAENCKTNNKNNAQTGSPETPISPNDASKCAKNTDKPKHPPSWIETFTWPEGVTAWALLLTLLVLAWQSTETRAAAQASLKQSEIQAAGLKHWIVVKNWRSELIDEKDSPRFSDMSRRIQIRIRFDLVNESNFPLTLLESTVTFTSNIAGQVLSTTWQAPKNYPLYPNVPLIAIVPVDINDTQLKDFSEGYVIFRIKGGFEHIGMLKEREIHPLQGILLCGESETVFDEEIPAEPARS